MSEVLVIEEFAKILRKYMEKFSLEAIDIAYLAKSVKRSITSILNNTGSLKLETVEAISKSFGLRYFEFCNPNHPMPSFHSLPEKTKQRIEYRRKEGPAVETNYTPSDINKQIGDVLSNFKEGDEFLAEEIANKILQKYGIVYSVTEIVNRFKKSFHENIEITKRKDMNKKGPGPKPLFHKLKKVIKD